jgi:hypothetical protein
VNIDLQAGKLYRCGEELMMWKTSYIAPMEPLGVAAPYDPILILELLPIERDSPLQRRGDLWAHVLAGGMAGWVQYVQHLNLEPIDQEAP